LLSLYEARRRTAFTAIHAVPITTKGLSPAFEGAQADADLTAGAGQSPGSYEQKASHFFRNIDNATISAMAFPLRCSSFHSLGEACG
jgi:hypothetical protein